MKRQMPFTSKTIKNIYQPWLKIINTKECASIVNIPKRDQLYRLKQFPKNKNLQIILLDIKTETIEDPPDLDLFLKQKINNKKNQKILFILDADKFLDEKNSLLSYINTLFHKKKLSIIYLFQKNIGYKNITLKYSAYSTLYQNIFYYPFFKTNDMLSFISYMEIYFHLFLPRKIKKLIIENCGSSPWLTKQAIRQFNQDHSEKEIFTNDSMKIKINILYQELTEPEKNLLKKILKNEYRFSCEEKEIINYLTKINLLKKDKKNYSLTIPLLEQFIKDEINNQTQININEREEITINSVNISNFFSKRERKLLKHLIKNHSQIINREKTALIIWGENYQEDYTDWALDQFMRRIRNKLVKLGLNNELIKTIRNQGFIFNQ